MADVKELLSKAAAVEDKPIDRGRGRGVLNDYRIVIETLRAKGLTWGEISAWLKENGVNYTAATIQHWWYSKQSWGRLAK